MKFNEWESIPYFKDKGDSILDIVMCAAMLISLPGCFLVGNLCGFYTGLRYLYHSWYKLKKNREKRRVSLLTNIISYWLILSVVIM